MDSFYKCKDCNFVDTYLAMMKFCGECRSTNFTVWSKGSAAVTPDSPTSQQRIEASERAIRERSEKEERDREERLQNQRKAESKPIARNTSLGKQNSAQVMGTKLCRTCLMARKATEKTCPHCAESDPEKSVRDIAEQYERLESAKFEEERRAEQERASLRAKTEQDRVVREKAEHERAREKSEQVARDRVENERLTRERAEKEKSAERESQERAAREKQESEQLQKEKEEQYRLLREKEEQIRLLREKEEQIRVLKEAQERLAREDQEQEASARAEREKQQQSERQQQLLESRGEKSGIEDYLLELCNHDLVAETHNDKPGSPKRSPKKSNEQQQPDPIPIDAASKPTTAPQPTQQPALKPVTNALVNRVASENGAPKNRVPSKDTIKPLNLSAFSPPNSPREWVPTSPHASSYNKQQYHQHQAAQQGNASLLLSPPPQLKPGQRPDSGYSALFGALEDEIALEEVRVEAHKRASTIHQQTHASNQALLSASLQQKEAEEEEARRREIVREQRKLALEESLRNGQAKKDRNSVSAPTIGATPSPTLTLSDPTPMTSASKPTTMAKIAVPPDPILQLPTLPQAPNHPPSTLSPRSRDLAIAQWQPRPSGVTTAQPRPSASQNAGNKRRPNNLASNTIGAGAFAKEFTKEASATSGTAEQQKKSAKLSGGVDLFSSSDKLFDSSPSRTGSANQFGAATFSPTSSGSSPTLLAKQNSANAKSWTRPKGNLGLSGGAANKARNPMYSTYSGKASARAEVQQPKNAAWLDEFFEEGLKPLRTECPSCRKKAVYDDLVGCSACQFVPGEEQQTGSLQDSGKGRITVGKDRPEKPGPSSEPCLTCGTVGNRDDKGECVFCNDALIADLDHVLTSSPRALASSSQLHSAKLTGSSSPRSTEQQKQQDENGSSSDARRSPFSRAATSSGGGQPNPLPRRQPSRVQMQALTRSGSPTQSKEQIAFSSSPDATPSTPSAATATTVATTANATASPTQQPVSPRQQATGSPTPPPRLSSQSPRDKHGSIIISSSVVSSAGIASSAGGESAATTATASEKEREKESKSQESQSSASGKAPLIPPRVSSVESGIIRKQHVTPTTTSVSTSLSVPSSSATSTQASPRDPGSPTTSSIGSVAYTAERQRRTSEGPLLNFKQPTPRQHLHPPPNPESLAPNSQLESSASVTPPSTISSHSTDHSPSKGTSESSVSANQQATGATPSTTPRTKERNHASGSSNPTTDSPSSSRSRHQLKRAKTDRHESRAGENGATEHGGKHGHSHHRKLSGGDDRIDKLIDPDAKDKSSAPIQRSVSGGHHHHHKTKSGDHVASPRREKSEHHNHHRTKDGPVSPRREKREKEKQLQLQQQQQKDDASNNNNNNSAPPPTNVTNTTNVTNSTNATHVSEAPRGSPRVVIVSAKENVLAGDDVSKSNFSRPPSSTADHTITTDVTGGDSHHSSPRFNKGNQANATTATHVTNTNNNATTNNTNDHNNASSNTTLPSDQLATQATSAGGGSEPHHHHHQHHAVTKPAQLERESNQAASNANSAATSVGGPTNNAASVGATTEIASSTTVGESSSNASSVASEKDSVLPGKPKSKKGIAARSMRGLKGLDLLGGDKDDKEVTPEIEEIRKQIEELKRKEKEILKEKEKEKRRDKGKK